MPYFKWTSLMIPFKVSDVGLKLPETWYIRKFIQGCVSSFKTKFTFLLDTKIVNLLNDYLAIYEANFEIFLWKTEEEKQ